MHSITWTKHVLALISVALLRLSLPFVEATASDRQYSIGVAKVDITPAYPIRLHGFGGRRTESEGITQNIWAKALAICADGDEPVIIFTVDNLGIRLPVVEEVAKRLQAKAGIKRDRIALTFTHSHTTPKTTGSADTIFSTPIPPDHQRRIDQYTAELTDDLEQVALAALADRTPAQLEWGVGKVGFAKNRRTEGGPVDHDLPMLIVKSPRGEIRAIYVTYACHCVTLSNNKISGDWAGYAQEAIERNHPGAIAMVSIGCGSDSNPSSGATGDNIAAAAEQGGEIAAEVERLLPGGLKPITGGISATLRSIDLPLNKLPSRRELESLAAQDSPQGYNATFQLARLNDGEALQAVIDYPIQSFTFGNSLAMVFLAGEVCVDYSIRLKRELAADRVWLHGYSNDFCAYIPSERLVAEGGYGGGAETVYFALPATLKAGLEDKIVAEVRRQLPENFHSPHPPKRTSRFTPTAPDDALASIQVGNSFVVELMAAEPLVVDPVAIDFGPDGSLWVAEMRDYARDVNEQFNQSGSIRQLIDRDGDGKLDRAAVFAAGLRFPTDVKVWRKGVIVCDAPDVIYLEDTDGDGRADVRKVLLTGFETHNAQARVNSLRWGLDNWLYGSCGLFGGSIRTFAGQQLELGNRDFRFKPDTGIIEPVTGRSQQGRTRDDWGNWFGCDNGTLCKHYPLVDHYLARNPYVISPSTERYVPAGSEPERLYPIGQPVLFKLSGPPGRPTSACGLGIYRDELLGPELDGNAFVAEPVNQLVHRLVLSNDGVTFQGHRASEEAQREFLASTDPWFRPVQVRTGTDGCLWIVDMCRYVIEHPRFLPPETLRELDVRAGNKTGRIYRVRPRDRAPRQMPKLRGLETVELVAALDSPNGPQRDLVQQILIERGDDVATPLLETLAARAKRPAVRLQALCTLDGLSALSEAVVLRALRDESREVRRRAIRLSEPLLDSAPNIFKAVAALAADDEPRLQLQLAYSLGESKQPRAAQVLAKLAWRYQEDSDIQAAVLSSVHRENAAAILDDVLSKMTADGLPRPLCTTIITVATKLANADQLRATIMSLSQSFRKSPTTSQLALLSDMLESCEPAVREQLTHDPLLTKAFAQLVAAAKGILSDSEQPDDAKLLALRAAAAMRLGQDQVITEVGQLLSARSSPTLQQAAIEFLANSPGSAAGDQIIANWDSYTSAVRERALQLIFSRQRRLPQLLSGIEKRIVKAAELDALQRQRLLQHPDREIRDTARAALAGEIDANRQAVIDSYAAVASLPGAAAQGRLVFQKYCVNCHRLDDQGHSVGPDLAALTNRTTIPMLESLFDPNRTVDERYQSYVAVTDEGRVYTGILTKEDSNSVTLLEPGAIQHVLLRNALDELRNTRISLMPEGFEKDLSPNDVANLFAYVVSQGKPWKKFPGNMPKVVEPQADGSLNLLATDCEIYGQDIAFEPHFQNIGFWHDKDDRVVWTVELPAAYQYDLYLQASCANESAGNRATIDGFNAPMHITIPGTGGWDQYKRIRVGRASLTAGRHRIVVRPADAALKNALMDLRGLDLISTTTANRKPASGTFNRSKTSPPSRRLQPQSKVSRAKAP